MLLAYVVSLLITDVDWGQLAWQLVWPHVQWTQDYLAMLVAVAGTTISPYLFFWQAAEEVEDMHADPRQADLLHAPAQGPGAMHRIEVDTVVGMAFSNTIALAIMVTVAAALHFHGITNIESAAQAAAALRPVAGRYASAVFAIGIIGTGLLAVPVLAGSAAYAIGEARQWPTGLGRRPKEAQAFYGTIVIATLVGMVLNYTPIGPIQALYWSAMLNGMIAVPLMPVLMLMSGREDIMGEFTIRGWLRVLGWAATAFMTVTVAAMAWTSL